MPRIRFTSDPKLPRDWADKPYRKDTEHDVSEDEANRWLRRGVAVVVGEPMRDAPDVALPPAGAAEAVAGASEAVEIPDDWREQHHMARIALARKLRPPEEQIDTAAEADAVIQAEAGRRAVAS